MQNPNSSAAAEKGRIIAGNRCVQSCREVLAIYNALSWKEKILIPSSLIRAICIYARLEKPEEQKPAKEFSTRNMSDLTIRILELILYYSGTDSRKEACAVIGKDISVRDCAIIRRILEMKKKLELEATNREENEKKWKGHPSNGD